MLSALDVSLPDASLLQTCVPGLPVVQRPTPDFDVDVEVLEHDSSCSEAPEDDTPDVVVVLAVLLSMPRIVPEVLERGAPDLHLPGGQCDPFKVALAPRGHIVHRRTCQEKIPTVMVHPVQKICQKRIPTVLAHPVPNGGPTVPVHRRSSAQANYHCLAWSDKELPVERHTG